MGWQWYGVKTFYATSALGKPRKKDRYFDPAVALLEERVVLIRARNFDEAIAKGEKEAKRYSSEFTPTNRYGQIVRQRYLGVADAYVLGDPPGNGREVFSRTELVPAKALSTSFARSRVPIEAARERWRRTKFLDKKYSGGLGRRVV